MSIIISLNRKIAIESKEVSTYFVINSQYGGYIFSACVKGDEKPNILGEYKSELEAKKALETVIRAVASEEKIVMTPDESQLKALLYGHTEVWHHATGKKTKGHGGS